MKNKTVETSSSLSRAAIDWRSGLTYAALVLAVALVVARAMMLESLRDAFAATPGSTAGPSGPGAAAGLVLDLLCCVPALLVLLRRAVDGTYVVRWNWSHVLTGVFCICIAASVGWADDKFAAAVNAAHFIAAMAILWAASQLVRSWLRVRMVGSICFGLLLVYLAHGFMYRFVELPDDQKTFQEHRADLRKQIGLTPDSYFAQQFEKKLENGEMIGFNGSPNSYGAAIVLLLGVSCGLMIQRLADGNAATRREAVIWTATMGLAIPLAIWILCYTQSKAAIASPLLFALILLIVWKLRPSMQRRANVGYVIGAAIILAGIATVIGYGLHFHSLPTASLNFRWRYWSAAWEMFLQRPWLGVGWANFGQHYLHFRLPVAAEEVQDPHDFPLKFLTELGFVGAAIGIAWIARFWWEWTRPIVPPSAVTAHDAGMESSTAARRTSASPATAFGNSNRHSGPTIFVLIVAGAIGINILAAIDFTQSGSWLLVELMNRLLYACALLIGALLAALRSLNAPEPDDRPAPWLLYAMLAALGVFLIHNLIEFSLFETGPMMIFALLAGFALGVRQPTSAGRRRQTPLAIGWLLGATTAWVAAAIMLVVPTVTAESLAHQADEHLRAGRINEASGEYLDAYFHQRLNADYAFRAAVALMDRPGFDRATVKNRLDLAIVRDPSTPKYYLTRAQLNEEMRDKEATKRDYSRALELDPNEVTIHRDYADALRRLDLPADAAEQYAQAIHYNDLLPKEEPKRINDASLRASFADALWAQGKIAQAIEQYKAALADDELMKADDPQKLPPARMEEIRGKIGQSNG